MMAVMEKSVVIRGRTPSEVFDFCLDGVNFARIFPEPIRPVGKIDTRDLRIEKGREFDFLHWMLFCIPCKWRVHVVELKPDELFIDQMQCGPLKYFRHEHLVAPCKEGTLYTDRVTYHAYGGGLFEKLFVNGYMRRIFDIRHRNMRSLLEHS